MNPSEVKNNRRNAILGLSAIFIIVVFGIGYFLFSKDEGGITGVQALGQLGKEFWIWAFAGSAIAIGLWFGFLKSYLKLHDFGATRPLLILGIVVMSITWMKGCDVKESKGVTSEKGRIGGAPAADTNRVPAEDLLPGK